MAPDDEILEVNDGEEEEEVINIIPHTNPGMKPYSYRMAGGGNGSAGYSWNGTEIAENPGSITVMIGDEDELTNLAEHVGTGTIAYKAGWKEAWQLDTDGETWVQMIGGDN